MKTLLFQSDHFLLYTRKDAALVYALREPQTEIPLAWPVLEIDGKRVAAAPDHLQMEERRFLNDVIEQITLRGTFGGSYTLTMRLRVCAHTPFLRFSY